MTKDPAPKNRHQSHRFIIPVEFRVHQNHLNTGGQYKNTTGMSVTVLMCECGERKSIEEARDES